MPAVGPPRGALPAPAGEAPEERWWPEEHPPARRVPSWLERLRAPGLRPLRPPGDTEVLPPSAAESPGAGRTFPRGREGICASPLKP